MATRAAVRGGSAILPGVGVALLVRGHALCPSNGALKLDQPQAGARRVSAFAVGAAARPRQRLLLGVDGQDAVADRHGVLDGDLHQPVIGVVADDVVVRGLAADDAAERDGAVPLAVVGAARNEPRGSRLRQHLRDLERARHRDALVRDALRLERGDGAADELVGDLLVEARLDDEHARAHFAASAAWPRCSSVCPSLTIISLDPARADDAQPEGLETDVDVRRRVGQQHHVADAEIAQDLRADADLDPAPLARAFGGLGRLRAPARSIPTRDFGRRSRISTTTPRPSSSIMRSDLAIWRALAAPRRRRAGRRAD